MNYSIRNCNKNYIGDRGVNFKKLLIKLLKLIKLNSNNISKILSDDNIKLFGSSFTSEHIDKLNNYQFYEQLGDITANKFLVWYFYRRFPYLKMKEGVQIVARLRIKYGAKEVFYKIANALGFWDFISAPVSVRSCCKKSLLEDVFEAFIGVSEYIIDKIYGVGVGYSIIYTFLKKIFDNIKISLKYEDLFDPKTRIKELFDYNSDLGSLKYKYEKILLNEYIYFKSKIYIFKEGKEILISEGYANLKIDSEQNVANKALKILHKKGYKNKVPKFYDHFNELKKLEGVKDIDIYFYINKYNYIGIKNILNKNDNNIIKDIDIILIIERLITLYNKVKISNKIETLVKIIRLFLNIKEHSKININNESSNIDIMINSDIFYKNIYIVKKLYTFKINLIPVENYMKLDIK